MPIANAQPARFTPIGVADTLSASDSRPGLCRSLANLIADPSTPNTYQCRPAAVVINSFAGFTTPAVVSAALSIGNMIYGMIGSARFAGKDEPFAYNISTNAFVAVTGVLNVNCPTTQSATGEWTPPMMAMMGVMVAVTHPGFPGAGVNFGWFDLTNPAAPVWTAGDTATNSLGGVPSNVIQFNNRFYFALNNTLPWTDALTNPPTRTNASQILTIGDSTVITAFAGVPLSTTSTGILQAFLAFKAQGISQVTGDSTTSDLAVNDLNTTAGTGSPRSVVSTDKGALFVDDDGLRLVEYSGVVSDPMQDIRVPFINASLKSRISACYNKGIYRVSLKSGILYGNPYQEFWLDLTRKGFNGPHPFRQDLAIPNHTANSTIVFDSSKPGKMIKSDLVQSASSVFTEYGTAMTFSYQTSPIGEPESLYANSSTESTINIAYPATGQFYAVSASDESGGSLATAIINTPNAGAVWGLFNWLAANWGAAQYGLKPVKIPWTQPLVFSKVVVNITGPCAADFKIGALKMLYKVLGYSL